MKDWEVRVGLVQVIILVGIVVGAMVSAFLLGYTSGHKNGIETARRSTINEVPRFPVAAADDPQELGADHLTEMYARLHNLEQSGADEPAKVDSDLPSVQNPSKVEPLEPLGGSEVKPDVAALDNVRVLGQGAIDAESVAEGQTLGALLRNQVEDVVPVASPQNKIEKVVAPSITPSASPAKAKLPADRASKQLQEAEVKFKQSKKEQLQQAEVKQKTVVPATPVVTTRIVRGTVVGGWYAQVSAPRQIEDANKLADLLVSSGFQVAIERATVRGEQYFRVLVGPEGSRELAQRMKQQLVREPYVTGDPFVRLIK